MGRRQWCKRWSGVTGVVEVMWFQWSRFNDVAMMWFQWSRFVMIVQWAAMWFGFRDRKNFHLFWTCCDHINYTTNETPWAFATWLPSLVLLDPDSKQFGKSVEKLSQVTRRVFFHPVEFFTICTGSRGNQGHGKKTYENHECSCHLMQEKQKDEGFDFASCNGFSFFGFQQSGN